MKQVESYQELSKLIMRNLKKNVVTNQFVLKSELEKEIEQKRLYAIEIPQGLLLIRDRGTFLILNYYLYDIEQNQTVLEILEKKQLKKPIIVEIVGKNEKDINYLKTSCYFQKLGFQLKIERERFAKIIEEKIKVENQEVEIALCENKDVNEVIGILQKNFNPFYGCIPTKNSLQDDIDNKNVYKAILENKIVGILHQRINSKVGEIRHIAVDENYRKRGIASKLLVAYEKNIILEKSIVWTGKENREAQELYQKYGYQKDGYISQVLGKEL